ncbi:hypothetical protein JMJ77_0013482, partial [Colletotrichum scovillei]
MGVSTRCLLDRDGTAPHGRRSSVMVIERLNECEHCEAGLTSHTGQHTE